MTDISAIEVPRVEGLGIEFILPATIKLSGMITRNGSNQDLAGFFRTVHSDAISRGLREVFVDVSRVTFVNSSAIRLFIDWASWIKSDQSPPYILRFVTSRRFTWQQTAFTALTALMKDVLVVERVD
jgi:hypothetical protein